MSSARKVTNLSPRPYFYEDFLKELEKEIQKKAFLVALSLDSFTRAELFAYETLKANGYFSVPDSEETDTPST